MALYMGNRGKLHPYKWNYGPLYITGDDAYLIKAAIFPAKFAPNHILGVFFVSGSEIDIQLSKT